MTALIQSGAYVMEAHASWSYWACRCGACRYGAEAFGYGPSFRYRPRTPQFQCSFCGAVTEAIWPSEEMMAGVERVLMMRPDPSTRNWFPGETLIDLMRENGEHGILDNLERLNLAVSPGDVVFSADETRIRVDNLPALKPRIRQEIGA